MVRSKTKQFKIQQNTFKESQIELENLRKRDENQRNEIKKLHESVRKKSEKEKQFDDIRKRLLNREKKVEEREKTLKKEYIIITNKNNKKINRIKRSIAFHSEYIAISLDYDIFSFYINDCYCSEKVISSFFYRLRNFLCNLLYALY